MNSIVLIVGIAIVHVLIPTVTSLRCRSCLSKTSQLDCHQQKKNEHCYRGDYKCAISSYRIKDENYYFRGCMESEKCNVTVYCQERSDKDNCKLDCCTGDLCNSVNCSNSQKGPDLYCKSCAQSLRHCELSQKNISCLKGKEKCLEVEDKCFDTKLQKCVKVTGNSSYCSFSCCTGNHCNAGATLSVSGISIAFGAIVGLAVYFL